MLFSFKVYKKKYLRQAIKELEKEMKKKVDYKEKENYLEINDEEVALQVADYYIYIYNENN